MDDDRLGADLGKARSAEADAAGKVRIAEAALKAAADWANQRLVGGEPIANKQGIQFKIADMKLRLEASWALTLQALALRQRWGVMFQHGGLFGSLGIPQRCTVTDGQRARARAIMSSGTTLLTIQPGGLSSPLSATV